MLKSFPKVTKKGWNAGLLGPVFEFGFVLSHACLKKDIRERQLYAEESKN